VTIYHTARETDGVPAPSDFEPLGEYVLEDAARKLAERLSFNAYCKEYKIGDAREGFHAWLVVTRGHTTGDIRPAWQWEWLYLEFEDADERDTHADALV